MSRNHRLVPSKVFLKDLAKLPAEIRPKVEKALLELKENPHSARNIKKLTNVDVGVFRLRIGDFRLRYDVLGDVIHLHIIRHRKDVYKNK